MTNEDKPQSKASIEIEASPQEVWNALISPSLVAKYHLAPLLQINLRKDGSIVFGTKEVVMISGRIIELVPGEKLSHTFRFCVENHSGIETDGDTVVTYDLKRTREITELTVTHSGFESENQTHANITGGWPYILANLKHLLEKERENGVKS